MKGPSRVFQVEGTAHAKVQRQDRAWGVGGAERRPGWLEQGGRGQIRGRGWREGRGLRKARVPSRGTE